MFRRPFASAAPSGASTAPSAYPGVAHSHWPQRASRRDCGAVNRSTLLLLLPLLTGLPSCDGSDSAASQDGEPPPLILASERGDLKTLVALLGQGSPPDVRDSCDWTPLMKAALNGHGAAVDQLLAAGATVDAEDKGGYTAMMLAASNNHAPVVERLLNEGAMADHQEGTQGWTALIWAAKQGHRQTLETLIRHRADPSLRDFSGRTAADWARETGQTRILALLETADAP